ncbi:hypothetical protein HPB48_022956 [Haemaphysalis longicornis]|uniref:Uncharacterized protein n=1 Tax=Haemaphysalis longicornis TaxID=44386 RepID=A0A9J6FRB4_HAELO|nr:hypothetical protein HPB48_022956 [Haemaphysalis longicornis]
MLAFARENHAHPKIEYQNLDLMSDDEVAAFVREHGHFQRVYSFLTLHWITDQHHAVRNNRGTHGSRVENASSCSRPPSFSSTSMQLW